MITISESTPVVKFSDSPFPFIVRGTCSHKFVDSQNCLKCGWVPPQPGQPTEIGRDEILAFVKAASDRHHARLVATYPDCVTNHETLGIQWGKKYARIVTISPHDGTPRSAFGFIEIATGNLLKTASWASPAKGVRGNIRLGDASNGWNGAVGDPGMAYLR